jgi:hypothetical protein
MGARVRKRHPRVEVFRGGPKTVERAAGLLSEVAQLQIYEDVPDFLEAIAEMKAYGFQVAALSPVTFHRDVILEFDCLLIRETENRPG